ncbi:chorismate mutase [Calorimonas adulescens]|uniref:chorismate mutase n=2 Tax=Calorimonas adulescens TaxID=2606906 RepID=A0A5D8QCU9_9THEO|nr:chorismate mutase [Calorimonas adulescens]
MGDERMVRGIRGATTCENTAASIEEAVMELTSAMMEENDVAPEDVACIIYSVTSDIDAVFPASCARKLGLNNVALLDVQEMAKPGDLHHCIRALMLVNTDKRQDEMRFVYLREAEALRPDKVGK